MPITERQMLYNSTFMKFMSSQIHRHRKEFLHTPRAGYWGVIGNDSTASVLQDEDYLRMDDGDAQQ